MSNFLPWQSKKALYAAVVEQADAARDRSDPSGAAQLYRLAIAKGAPIGIRKQLANMLKDGGSFDEALFQYNQCLDHEPNNPDTLLQMGHLFKLQDEISKAAAYYDRAAKSPATAAEAGRELEALEGQPRPRLAAGKSMDSPISPQSFGLLEGKVETLATTLKLFAVHQDNQALLEELRNSFDALVPLFLNTASTISRIGKTLEDLTARVQAVEQAVSADQPDTTRG